MRSYVSKQDNDTRTSYPEKQKMKLSLIVKENREKVQKFDDFQPFGEDEKIKIMIYVENCHLWQFGN